MEVLSPELEPIRPELEEMLWQDELSSAERSRLVELVAWTIYKSEGLSERAIQAVAAHDVEEAVPALRGEVVPDDKTIRALLQGEYAGWNQELREITARVVAGDLPVVDGLWEALRSRRDLRRHEREAVIETLAILEIRRIRAGESDESVLTGLPLSERYALLAELAPLPTEEAVEWLLSEVLSSTTGSEYHTYMLALETYEDEYFSRLPEVLAPAHRQKMGPERTTAFLARVRDNLPRLEDRTALRLKAVLETPRVEGSEMGLKEFLEMPRAEGSEKSSVVDRKARVADWMRADLVSRIERQLKQRADGQ